MDVNTIIKLLDAGYTREEIQNMAGDGAAVENNAGSINNNELNVPESSEPSASDSSPAAPEQPAATSDESSTDALKKIVDDLAGQLKELTKTVQMNNIINSEQPPKPVQTAADILASIINPYTSKGEK